MEFGNFQDGVFRKEVYNGMYVCCFLGYENDRSNTQLANLLFNDLGFIMSNFSVLIQEIT